VWHSRACPGSELTQCYDADKGQTCVDGECVCPAPLSVCGPGHFGCFDLQTDRDNCGACGNSCGDAACVDGRCDLTCPPHETRCEADPPFRACVDLQTDYDACGACTNSVSRPKCC
jgi:hypothetical protein